MGSCVQGFGKPRVRRVWIACRSLMNVNNSAVRILGIVLAERHRAASFFALHHVPRATEVADEVDDADEEDVVTHHIIVSELAASQGFEPRSGGSEPPILPLDDKAMLQNWHRVRGTISDEAGQSRSSSSV